MEEIKPMKVKICPVCGREYTREYCEFCEREKHWDPGKILRHFPARIREDVQYLDIKLLDDDVQAIRDQGSSLIVVGSPGSGKTTYASALMVELLKLGYIEHVSPKTYKYVSIPELIYQLQSLIEVQDKEYNRVINNLSAVDILLLDDLGAERPTEWTRQVLYLVINRRYEQLKPVIITTDRTGDELIKRVGDRIVSRIHQMCKTRDMGEHDWRLGK